METELQYNNNISNLKKPYQIKQCRFDLDSPMMKEAMVNLGLVKQDLITNKQRSDFEHQETSLTNIRYRHYRQRMMETVNKLLDERRRIKVRQMALKVVNFTIQRRLPKELRQQEQTNVLNDVKHRVQLKFEQGVKRIESADRKKIELLQKSFDSFEHKIIIDKIRKFKNQRVCDNKQLLQKQKLYKKQKGQRELEKIRAENVRDLEFQQELKVGKTTEKLNRIRQQKSVYIESEHSQSDQSSDSGIEEKLQKFYQKMEKSTQQRLQLLQKSVSQKLIRNDRTNVKKQNEQMVDSTLIRSVSQSLIRHKSVRRRLRDFRLDFQYFRNKDNIKKQERFDRNKAQQQAIDQMKIAKTTERLLKNEQQVEQRREQISNDVAINSELTQLRKQDLQQILTQSKRIRDTRTTLMLEQEQNRKQLNEIRQQEEKVAVQKLNKLVISKQLETLERNDKVLKYFNSPDKAPTQQIKVIASQLGLRLPQNPRYLKINDKLQTMLKVEQEGDPRYGDFKRYIPLYGKQLDPAELEQLERETSKTAR